MTSRQDQQMPQNMDELQARKEYVRRRQKRVFSIVATALVVAFVISLLFVSGIFGSKKKSSPANQPNFGAASVCAPAGQDNQPAKYPQPSAVRVRVLNGTKSVGFARAVGGALENREFQIADILNYKSNNVERTTIYYGVNAVTQAYTLNANFSDAQMVMDNRQDDLVDVVVGASFQDLVPKKKVPTVNAVVENIKGCTPLDKVDKAKLPAVSMPYQG
jgi:hypothetical protein